MVIAMVIVSGGAFAQSGDAGTQSIFSTLGAGSRGIGLGKSFVSLADDASALYWNPAALRNVQTKQLTGMYMPLFGDFGDATYTYLAAVYPTLNAGALGLGFMRVGSSFEGFDASSVPTGTQDYSETQLLIGYAFEQEYGFMLGSLATGINFKIANQKLAALSSTSPGIDLGFRYLPDFNESLALAINIQDFVGPSHKLNVETDETARTIMAGAGYTHLFADQSALRFMLQLDLPERADNKFHVGAEYAFSQYVSLRMGMDDGDFTFGLGVLVSDFGFDYAMVNRETAGSSHPVSFTAQYGPTLFEQRENIAQQQAERDRELIQRAFLQRVQSHRDLAVKNENEGNIPVALDEWKIVLEYIPGDPEATERMEALTQSLIRAQENLALDREKQATIRSHFTQGLTFYTENDYVRARDEWQAVLDVDSTHAEALEYAAKTREKIDQSLASHVSRAQQLEGQGRLTEAIGEWNNVQLLEPGSRRARAAIQRIQQKIESQSKDLQQTAKRLRIVNLYDSALQQFNQGNYDGALKGLDQLLKLEPGHEDGKKLLAMTKRKLTPLTKAEEEQIRRLFLRGMQYFSKDEYAKAIAEWEKILEIDPTNESVQRNIDGAKERLKQLQDS